MHLITSMDDIAEGTAALIGLDPRLERIVEESGPIPLRHIDPGFSGLAHIIVSQLISRASANAIWARMCSRETDIKPENFIELPEDNWREFGLTRAKAGTISTVARAIVSNDLDLLSLGDLPGEQALSKLTAFKGIGAWTAEVYLMFCCGHPDIFPVGDVALRASVAMAFSREQRPTQKELLLEAAAWAPWRSVAARIFWAYYAARLNRDTLPI